LQQRVVLLNSALTHFQTNKSIISKYIDMYYAAEESTAIITRHIYIFERKKFSQNDELKISFFFSDKYTKQIFITLYALLSKIFINNILCLLETHKITQKTLLRYLHPSNLKYFLNSFSHFTNYAVHFLIKMRADGQTTLNTKQMLFIMIIQNKIQMIGNEKTPVKTRLPQTIFCWIIPH
jgi:hypothetical protein